MNPRVNGAFRNQLLNKNTTNNNFAQNQRPKKGQDLIACFQRFQRYPSSTNASKYSSSQAVCESQHASVTWNLTADSVSCARLVLLY